MVRITQNMPLAVDPNSKDQPNVNRQLTEVIRQLWQRQNSVLKEFEDLKNRLRNAELSINAIHFELINYIALDNNITRITVLDSPYIPLVTDRSIYADTDGGAITVNLPPGIDKTKYTIKNCGLSGNDVTINPNGTELFFGFNLSEFLIDSEVLDFQYDVVEGWR